MYTPSMKDRMAELERKKSEFEGTLARSTEPPNLRLHPGISKVYARKVEQLEAALEAPATRAEAMELIRSMIDQIVLTPVDNGLRAELFGDLAEIVAVCEQARGKKNSPERHSRRVNYRWLRGPATILICSCS